MGFYEYNSNSSNEEETFNSNKRVWLDKDNVEQISFLLKLLAFLFEKKKFGILKKEEWLRS